MHIGLLGGVFNPPHLGHLIIAQQVVDFTDIDEVWFLPNYGQRPSKPEVASVAHRLAMTRLLKLPHTRVSALEIDNALDGNTINLTPILKEKYPNNRFTFIIGSDQLPKFTTWGSWQKLLTLLPFLVVPRAGFPVTPLYQGMTVLNNQLLVVTNISSTLVRERIKGGLSIKQLVPPGVKNYIEKHHLYE